MSRKLAEDIRREKARNLRYKKPMLQNINYDSILNWLYDAQNACDEWAYLDDQNREALMDALDGNDDEYDAYQMSFTTLSGDLDRMYSDLNDGDIPENFDDVVVGLGGAAGDNVLGFDEYEGDYFGLDSGYETRIAIEEAQKRLERLTKKQLMQLYTDCSKIMFSYMALRYRLDELDAAVNILKSLNGEILRDVTTICDLYDEWAQNEYDTEINRKFERAAGMLPEEAWLR